MFSLKLLTMVFYGALAFLASSYLITIAVWLKRFTRTHRRSAKSVAASEWFSNNSGYPPIFVRRTHAQEKKNHTNAVFMALALFAVATTALTVMIHH